MKTSAGAPLSICRASAELAPYETTTFLFVWRRYNALASSNAFFRLAAPNTRRSLLWACAGPPSCATVSTAAVKPRSARRETTRNECIIANLVRYIYINIATNAAICKVVAADGPGRTRQGLGRAIPTIRGLRDGDSLALEHGDVLQERNNADHDHDDAGNALG